MTGPTVSRQIPHMTPAGQPTSESDPPPQPGPILTERAGRHLHCQPQRGGAGQPGRRPPWPRSPTPPNKASNESASATIWWSGSWPIPASPSTHEPSTQPTKLNNKRSRLDVRVCMAAVRGGDRGWVLVSLGLRSLLGDDLHALVDAFVADRDTGAGDQLLESGLI